MKFWCLKEKKVPQPGKNNILGKYPEILSKVVFFGVGERFIPLMCYFWVYMLHHNCLYDSVKTACFGKVSFSSYKRKCSRPIRFQNFLNFNISKTTWVRNCGFFFFDVIRYPWKLQFNNTVFVGVVKHAWHVHSALK